MWGGREITEKERKKKKTLRVPTRHTSAYLQWTVRVPRPLHAASSSCEKEFVESRGTVELINWFVPQTTNSSVSGVGPSGALQDGELFHGQCTPLHHHRLI